MIRQRRRLLPPEAVGLEPSGLAGVRVSLTVDKDSNRVVARVIDKDTGEVKYQVPSEKLMRSAAALREFLGAALDTQV